VTAQPAAPVPARAAAVLLLAGGATALLPFSSPALALALGAAIGVTAGNPYRATTQRLATRLLQACVVGIGFGLSFTAVAAVGLAGIGYTAVVVLLTVAGGIVIGRSLGVDRQVGLLVASGTGICGGSAIAAVGSAIRARGEAMSAALAVVFVLNAIALYAFPLIGRLLDLTQSQFALWAALAIHDTSSVVGAAASYGEQALAEATVLKLARALWILPLALAAAVYARANTAATDGTATARSAPLVPWFIALFILAALTRSLSPAALLPVLDAGARAARAALPLVLFLIGAGLTRTTIRAVGARPLLQAVLLWLIVASATLALILRAAGPGLPA
jgi:uncharacterized integral membrane protein (TIGR00698 family)